MKHIHRFSAAILLLVALSTTAQAIDRIEVYADSTVYGVPGFLVEIIGNGPVPITYFMYENGGQVSTLAVRLRSDQTWWGMPENYEGPALGAQVGDSWGYLPTGLGETQNETVDGFDIRTVSAGTFAMIRCSIRLDNDPTSITAVASYADGVGHVRIFDTVNHWMSDLRSYYIVGGHGYLPLAVGNWWDYEKTAVSGVDDLPVTMDMLHPCAPNPFNPATEISFEMAVAGPARLTVYDAAGRLVRTLFDGERDAGHQAVFWHGRDDAGHAVAAGVYLYRLEIGELVQTRAMTLVK